MINSFSYLNSVFHGVRKFQNKFTLTTNYVNVVNIVNSIPNYINYFNHQYYYRYYTSEYYPEDESPPDLLLKSFMKLFYTDLQTPHSWFPLARRMKRTIHLHVGPTNSGKTHTALERLAQSNTGMYCGPLRLLAEQVFERLNEKGIICNLHTGDKVVDLNNSSEEERAVLRNGGETALNMLIEIYKRNHTTQPNLVSFLEDDPESKIDVSSEFGLNKKVKHHSCTVEMAVTNEVLDCVVIDEYQLIADPGRGWAWTRALLGCAAREIHLCGDTSCINLVKSILHDTGDEIIVHEYKRLSSVKIAPKPLGRDWITKLQPGDAVVAFSRKNIFQLKSHIEKAKSCTVSVVYGSLPPENRSEQARRFNTQNSGQNILVATDAIGLGLNLNIRRIIFSQTEKYDGTEMRELSGPEIRQIGGRAGRFGSIYPSGIISALTSSELDLIRAGYNSSVIQLNRAGLFPTFEQIQRFAIMLEQTVQKIPFSKDTTKHSKPSQYSSAISRKAKRLWDFESDIIENHNNGMLLHDFFDQGLSLLPFGKSQTVRRSINKFIQINELEDVYSTITIGELKQLLLSNTMPKKDLDTSSEYTPTLPAEDELTKNIALTDILQAYKEMSEGDLNSKYFFCQFEQILYLAKLVDLMSLSLREKYAMCMSPLDEKHPLALQYFVKWGHAFSKSQDVTFPSIKEMSVKLRRTKPRGNGPVWDLESANTQTQTSSWEQIFKVCELYLWLGYRFEGFSDLEGAILCKEEVQRNISNLLDIPTTFLSSSAKASRKSRYYSPSFKHRSSKRFDQNEDISNLYGYNGNYGYSDYNYEMTQEKSKKQKHSSDKSWDSDVGKFSKLKSKKSSKKPRKSKVAKKSSINLVASKTQKSNQGSSGIDNIFLEEL